MRRDLLLADAAAGRNTNERAWLIAVAHPRLTRLGDRLTRDQARDVLTQAEGLALTYAGRGGIHPLENVDRHNPRPGLRRWVSVNTATGDRSIWREAWASIHHDGSVTIAAAVGGHRMSSDDYFEGSQVQSAAIECGIADLMGLLRATAEATGNDEYEVRVGIEWSGDAPLSILTVDNFGQTFDGVSTPLHHYTPVETTVNAVEAPLDYYWHVHDLAQDCVNQGGISNVRMIQPPDRDQQ